MQKNLLNTIKIKKYLKNTSWHIKIFKSIPSTIDYVKINATKTPQICLAEQQTAGKGRLGRTWHSPFGLNIYLSCLWNFNKDISEISGLSLVTSLATIKALTSYTKSLKIKWPNDILYNNQKLAGVLIEINAESHGTSKAIISIGLNVNMTKAPINQNWTSLINILNLPQDRNQIIGQFINQLFADLTKFENQGLSPFLSEWQQYAYLKNKKITLLHGQKSISGIVTGINDQGHLLLKHKDGSIAAYSSGDTSISSPKVSANSGPLLAD
jgi:BirA family biotin operon repressor/biotin-[acetyl-CoA-carboxylase] ligase